MNVLRVIATFLVIVAGVDVGCHAFIVTTTNATPTFITASTSSSALQMTVLTYGTKKKDFKPGTPLSKAVAQLGVKPRYSCKKGDCATCELMLAGRMTKPCVAKVPAEPRLKSLQEKGLEIRM
mmetsp:Transcript_6917/g.20316  ORF Transcript_6917/g.20316 Transcript_6917/m.20316 type:complete len:123 (-) Transcript_6917:138-506(-)